MNNIVIIGLGNMGLAHLSSFAKEQKRKKFYLVEKNINLHNKIITFLKKKNFSNINLLKEIPKNLNINFCIIATKSDQRLEIIKKLTNHNTVKKLFLEKFLFNNIDDYRKFNLIKKKKKFNTHVNIWSEIFLNKINLKKNKKKIFIEVFLPKYKILTNLIHFYEIFKILVGENFKIDFSNFSLKKINKSYYDGKGKVILYDKKGSEMCIQSKKMKNNINFNFYSGRIKKKFIISDGYITCLNQNKKKILFPLASRVTNKFFNSLIKKKKFQLKFPKYNDVEKGSKKIIVSLSNQFKKEIKIL
jgi:hypothetical protein